MSYQTITVNSPKWVRSPDGVLAGVCRGLGQSFNIDPWLLRIIWLVAILAFGTGILLYVLLALALPREDRAADAYQKRFLGVCSKIASKLDIEVGLVRVAALGLGILSLGVTIVGYIILYFVFEQDGSSYKPPKKLQQP